MTKREKNILLLAAVVAVVFAITQGFPLLKEKYTQNKAEIAQIKSDIERERRLFADSEIWQERRLNTDQELENLRQLTVQETTVPLISANLQRVVRTHANNAGLNITSSKLAESMRSDGWLLVEQELSIQTDDQSNILGFLRSVENSTPKLGISAFSLRRNRNRYAGTITVVGFSRASIERESGDV
ncbi:MAG: GspMb/PilO family protein [Pseudohongiellaceae bacterium]|nr:GspMb/PilO family protein [Pseudohongiellaceae bacterium]